MRGTFLVIMLALLLASTARAQRNGSATVRPRELSALDGDAIARALGRCAQAATGTIRIERSAGTTRSSSSGADGRCVSEVAGALPRPPPGAEVRLDFTIADHVVRFDGMRSANAPPPPRPPPRVPSRPMHTEAENAALDAQVLACWSRRDPPCVRSLLEGGRAETDRQLWWLETSLILAGDHEAFCRVYAEHRARYPQSAYVGQREVEADLWCD